MIYLLVFFSILIFTVFIIHLAITYFSIQRTNDKDQERTADKFLNLKNESYVQTVKNYSGRAEMLNFTQNPSQEWAEDNINYLTSSLKISLVYVYTAEQQLIYSTYDSTKLKKAMPIDCAPISERLKKESYPHFFEYIDGCYYEFFAAGIVPTSDAEKRETPAQGYLVLGKKWDRNYLDDLAASTDFGVQIFDHAKDTAKYLKDHPETINVARVMKNASGQTIACIVFSKLDVIRKVQLIFFYRSFGFAFVACIIIMIFFYTLKRTVVSPLHILSEALTQESPEPLCSFKSSTFEYCQMSELIHGFFEQRKELQNRLDEQLTLEEELRQNNEELSSLNELVHKQKQELKEIIENQGEGFALVNNEGLFTLVNPAACEMFGLSADELVGKSFRSFSNDENIKIINSHLEKRVEGKKDTYELKVDLANKTEKTLLITGVPHLNEYGNIIGSIVVFRDITQIKEAQDQIKQKNNELKKYFTAIEQNHAIIVITNTQGLIEYVNPKLTEITGYAAEEVIGRNPNMFKSGKTSASKYKELWQTITNGRVWRGEFVNIKKNGDEFIEKAIISPIKNSNGELSHFIAIKEDITELKKAEKIIKEKNKQQSILINNLPVHIYFKDKELRYQLVNDSFAELLNRPSSEIIGKLRSEVFETAELARIFEEVENKVISSQKANLNFETSHIDSTGEKHWLASSKVPYYNENGDFEGIVGVVHDITQRKKYEKTIIEKTRQFENTLNNLEDIYFKTDIDGNLLEASPSICRFFGCDRFDDIIKSHGFDQIYKTPENKKSLLDTILKEGKISHYSFVIRNKKGEKQYGETNAVVWLDKDEKPMGFEGIIRDMSERVKFEKMLKELNDNLSDSLETTNKQKVIIEMAHKDITDSIRYAQTIQNSFLPQEELIKSCFEDNFLLFKPKDIVSGDFYYVNKHGNKLVFAVADCTGHGVPGGFMTVLGIINLHEIVQHGRFDDASQILEDLRSRIKSTFRSMGNDSKNGLDIAICVVDLNSQEMQYAGAYNPLFIIRNHALMEYPATKNPIGQYLVEKKFANHTIQLMDNDQIYLFSDGFQDQFGGEKDRKFTKRRFKEMLVANQDLPLAEQREKMELILDRWQGQFAQTDDITVFAVKWRALSEQYKG